MKILCRHEWEYIIKPDKVVLVQCRKCGKTDFHSKNKKYIFSKLVNRTYCWCPKCKNDLVRDRKCDKRISELTGKPEALRQRMLLERLWILERRCKSSFEF